MKVFVIFFVLIIGFSSITSSHAQSNENDYFIGDDLTPPKSEPMADEKYPTDREVTTASMALQDALVLIGIAGGIGGVIFVIWRKRK